MSYQKELKEWKRREPKRSSSYHEYEKWLEEKPDKNYLPDGTPRNKGSK